jgi:hypothetical protein
VQFDGSFDESMRLHAVDYLFLIILYPPHQNADAHNRHPPPASAGFFHVEECGDVINNCEQQVKSRSSASRTCNSSHSRLLFSVVQGAKISWTTSTVRSATHPKLVKAGTYAHCLLVFSFSSQCTAAVPLTGRARPVSRVQMQQIASTSDDHRDYTMNCPRALRADCFCRKPCVQCRIACGRAHAIRAVAHMHDQARFAQ